MRKTIDIFPWNENFDTGLPSVDEQHRKLVQLLNQLASQLAFSPDSEQLEAIFNELTAYAVYHFQDEETIWSRYMPHDPMETQHLAGHQRFFETVIRLRDELKQHPLAEVTERVLEFLARWLASHILESDRRMAHVVLALQAGQTLEAAKRQADQAMAGSTRTLIDIILSIYGSLSTNTLRLMREMQENKLATEALMAQNIKYKALIEQRQQMETTLSRHADFTASLIEAELDGISACHGIDTAPFIHFAVWNPGMQALTGYTLDDVNRLGWYQTVYVDPAVQEQARQRMARMRQGDHLRREEWTITRKDGQQRRVEISTTPVTHPDGQPYVLAVMRDVSELASARLHLAQERSILKTLVQTIPDLVWLKDPKGVYLACNRKFEQLYGATEADIVGKTDHDFVSAETAACFRAHDLHAIASTVPCINEERLTFASDGHQELTETTKTPMWDASGQLIGVLGVGRDITERERARAELQQRENYLRTVLDNFPFLIWLKDEHSRFLAVNQSFAKASGLDSPKALVGKTDLDVWPPELARAYRADDQDVIASGQSKSVEERLKDRWMETYKSPVDIDGQVIGTVGFARDITDRKLAEEQLQLAASVFTHANEGIMITTPEGVLVDVNAAFTRITGFSHQEVLGRNASMLSSGRQSQEFYAAMWQALLTRGDWAGEICNQRKSGEVYVEQLTLSAVRNTQGEIIRFVGMFSDISRQKEHEMRLVHVAHYDPLTGLPNRVLLADRLRQAMAQTLRREEKLALVFIDLDGFKTINDTHGHATGDKLLIALAKRMGSALRDGDTLARMGGDEFVAVLLDLGDHAEAHNVFERMRLGAATPFLVEGLELQVSASMGVVFYPQLVDMDAEQLLRQADQAMYQAKLAGKNRFHVFDAEHDLSMRDQHEQLEAIRRALAKGEFELF